MCGIWGYIEKHRTHQTNELYKSFCKLSPRGPDSSVFRSIKNFVNTYIGFHRLSIMDPSTNGDQPYVHETSDNRTLYCICNGEIYNFKDIIKQFDLKMQSNSDCEIIHLLYEKYGFDTLIKSIRGEFAFMLIDVHHTNNKMKVYLASDQFGIRPLFYANDDNGFAISSELKGLVGLFNGKDIKRFKPGLYMELNITPTSFHQQVHEYYSFKYDKISITDIKLAKQKIKQCLVNSITDKLVSDRPLGCLLSGGLDSSLIAAISAKELKKNGKILTTFSIGMPGSTDKKYALMVAKHIKSNHHHFELSENDFLNALGDIVTATETHDITTIRASTGQYLISKLVAEKSNIKVLLIGDGADELCSGYKYNLNAPSPQALHDECRRLLKDIHLYDVLRADRGIASNGLEARVPFLDHRFVDLYMSIDPKLRMPANHKGVEKWLLRSSFDDTDLLPKEVLWRSKEAFSDGVSSLKKSWYQIIQHKASNMYSDEEFKMAQQNYTHCPPSSKEALYFRRMFEERFGSDDVCKVIPYMWLPKWCGDIKEPSARVLNTYAPTNL
jgi:asparagine synthase (glutamine-hydrolysing)